MSEKMREQFETAISMEAEEPVLAVFLSRRGDTYSTSTLHFAWWAWKRSRADIEIELPKLSGLNSSFVADGIQVTLEHNRYNAGVSDCRKAIHASGVKTK